LRHFVIDFADGFVHVFSTFASQGMVEFIVYLKKP